MTQQNVSQLFKTVRTQMNMTQTSLAKKIHRDANLITRIENGTRKDNSDVVPSLFSFVAKTLGEMKAKRMFGNLTPVLKVGTRTATRTTSRKPASIRAKAPARKARAPRKAPVQKAV